ncbi:putative secreted beta-glucosidase sim1 [Zygosaccharomyces mellis]|uniref:Putative secreted beta-glucosidase sim1 n=1 Tax=Zygosaccharomyces mellis TaxID=42258 RepID=A0A4C2E3T4_9SACH|nr:putative secreted beta-glucosidase sim1 [Zygosaccharomyces mellis]
MKLSANVLTAALVGSQVFVNAMPHMPIKRDEEDCSTTVAAHGDSHQHRRAVAVDYVYQTVTVDGNGNSYTPTASSSTPPSSSSASADSGMVTHYVTPSASSSAPPQAIGGLSGFVTSLIHNAEPSTTSSSPSPSATESSDSSSSSSSSGGDGNDDSSSSSSSSGSSSGSSSSSSSSGGGIFGDLSPFEGPNEKFQDGTIPCSQFPSGQGVIPIDWMNEGGWSGVENSDTSTGGGCKEGSYCSYACQAGMSKTQWPSDQPSDGRSVGGLYCKDGYLYRSNTDADYLCEWGVDAATVVSNLNEDVAICRTDYPGTENMVLPTYVKAGDSQPLTVVDEDNYYQWQGKPTSGQFYVNNAGVSLEDGCVWSTPGSGMGNWAPLNFGAGYASGVTYLSLIPNPNNQTPLNYNVKIVAADDSSSVSGECKYENGEFNGGNSNGCTTSVISGKAHFVLYN